MKRQGALILLAGAAIVVNGAQGGHELPVYPSFYPHEITIRTLGPGQAVDALAKATSRHLSVKA
jgi:hypothetical protein